LGLFADRRARQGAANEIIMADRVLATAGDWALATDGLQWLLKRRWKDGLWHTVSFVRSTKDILAQCMREQGTDDVTASFLLAGLPDRFDGKNAPATSPEPPRGISSRHARFGAELVPVPEHIGMYRVRQPDGSLSDMVNLTRAIDAVLAGQQPKRPTTNRYLARLRRLNLSSDKIKPRP
jgi:hypothetical protein